MAYSKTNWESLPSTNTPINPTNLNKIENELDLLDNEKIVQIFSGTISESTSGIVSEAISNFRFLFVKVGSSATWIVIPVIPNVTTLRGQNSYGGSSGIELLNVVGTYSNNGLTFNLTKISDLLLTSTGITDRSENYTTVTEIYGVR